MNDKDIAAQALLGAVPGIGYATIKKVTQHFEQESISWSSVWQRLSQLQAKDILSKKQFQQATTFNTTRWSEIEFLQRLSAERVTLISARHTGLYPLKLSSIATPPHFLYIRGNKEVVFDTARKAVLAVVGSRRNTPYGQQVTKKLITELADYSHQMIHVSGGMYGIDLIGHRQAICVGIPTVAVLGGGVLARYPYWQQQLLEEIIDAGGAVVSEYFPWNEPKKNQFIERNRVVAGLSDAVVVIEAAAKSGTLLTVDFALSNGREVGAVPGSVFSSKSIGTHDLLDQGAKIITSRKDIISLLGLSAVDTSDDTHSTSQTGNLNFETKIYQAIQSSPGMTTLELEHVYSLNQQKLRQTLSLLEISGKIVREGASWYQVN